MKTVLITLGGREYQVEQLPIRPSKAWRETFSHPIEGLIGSIQFTGQLITNGDGQELGQLVSAVGQMLYTGVAETVLSSMELALDIICAYSPRIQADRERIETEAYDDEVINALVEVLKLAYPFSEIINAIRGRMTNPTRKS